MDYEILCVFTPHGKTFTFRDVRITCSNETTLQFSYKAMSDDLDKVATFTKSNIAGWSITPKH